MEYTNKTGDLFFVEKLKNHKYATYKEKLDGTCSRFNAKTLISRDKKEDAEWDLKSYAEKNGFIKLTELEEFAERRANLHYIVKAFMDAKRKTLDVG